MADLFVLPTQELEGFGLVTLEAMASGLPVIGTPIGGTKEILGKFNADFLFDGTQPDSIAKLALEKYLIIKNNSQRWKQISEQGRKFVEDHYSWKQNVDSFERLIQRYIEK
jgi:glycosyltransferase involved in cell wall biosynthesis